MRTLPDVDSALFCHVDLQSSGRHDTLCGMKDSAEGKAGRAENEAPQATYREPAQLIYTAGSILLWIPRFWLRN